MKNISALSIFPSNHASHFLLTQRQEKVLSEATYRWKLFIPQELESNSIHKSQKLYSELQQFEGNCTYWSFRKSHRCTFERKSHSNHWASVFPLFSSGVPVTGGLTLSASMPSVITYLMLRNGKSMGTICCLRVESNCSI